MGNLFDVISEIAGMWICDNCETIAYVSVEPSGIEITQCACVQLSKENK
jgi:hypothetical protein